MHFLRKYGAAATIDGIPLITRGAVDLQANPTLAAGDAKVSKDGGAFANLATLPAVTPASGKAVRISLSATEMQAARVCIQMVDQTATKEWEDQVILIETYGHASATHAFDLSVATQSVSVATGGIAAASFAAGAVDAAALAADAVTEIWAKTMTELASVPGVTGTVLEALQWLFLLSRNKVTQTATTQALRNDADGASIATAAVSDDGTTFTRNEWS